MTCAMLDSKYQRLKVATMHFWPDSNGSIVSLYIDTLRAKNTRCRNIRCRIIKDFQGFIAVQGSTGTVGKDILTSWLRERSRIWSERIVVAQYAPYLNDFLDWLVDQELIDANPFAVLRRMYNLRWMAPIARALLEDNPARVLASIQRPPRFGSQFGTDMQEFLLHKRTLGLRYNAQERLLLSFDLYLQARPEVAGLPFNVLVRQWAEAASSPDMQVRRLQCGRSLARHLSRTGPISVPPVPNRVLRAEVARRRRKPYIYTVDEVERVLAAARTLPSPHSPLRPATLYMMLVLAYCVGLRLGEIARLRVGDVDFRDQLIDIRATKFCKSRRLPVTQSVMNSLRGYWDAREQLTAATEPDAPFFWNDYKRTGYSTSTVHHLLTHVIRRAGVRKTRGRIGPRIHDFRHAFVVHRMIAWYREGIDLQPRLPYLASVSRSQGYYVDPRLRNRHPGITSTR
jgi:integrase/recombinase XerD